MTEKDFGDNASLQRELFHAIETGDTSAVASLLSKHPGLVRSTDSEGQTPLHMAARFDDLRIGLTILSYGADVNSRFGNSGHTPLSWAVTCNALSFARGLIKLGVKPDLFVAAGVGELELVQSCFDLSGKLIPNVPYTGSTRYDGNGEILPCPPHIPAEIVADALYIACRNSQCDVAKWLLSKSPELDFKAYMGGTPLHWAYFGGSREIIENLIAAGANSHLRDDVLHCVPRLFGIAAPASWGMLFLVEKQLRNDPELIDFMDGHTSVLHVAIGHRRPAVVEHLLQHGANIHLANGEGKSAVQLAEEIQDATLLELIRRYIKT